jgi:hypothetical protein
MMSPEKKVLQMELAKEILMSEIAGRRANGQAGGMNYFDLFEDAIAQAVDIADLIEREVQSNARAWAAENNAEEDDTGETNQ